MKKTDWNRLFESGRDYSRMNLLLLHDILASSNNTEGSKALDVGCGTGDLARKLVGEGFQVTAIDPSEEAIKIAMQSDGSDGIKYVNLSADAIDSLGQKFDLITCKLVFVFLDDKQKFLNDAKNLLTPGGAIIIITPIRLGNYDFTSRFKDISVDPKRAEKLFTDSFANVVNLHTDYLDMDPYGAVRTYILKK